MDVWLELERQTLTALAAILAVAIVAGWRRPASRAGLVAASVAGALFYIWISGLRHVVPTEFLWTF